MKGSLKNCQSATKETIAKEFQHDLWLRGYKWYVVIWYFYEFILLMSLLQYLYCRDVNSAKPI